MADNENTPAQPTELPTDLTALSGDELNAAADAARAEAAELQSGDLADLSPEQVDRLVALADFVDSVSDRQETLEAERAANAERAQAAAARLAGPADEGDGEPAEGDGEPAEEETPAPEAVAAGGTRTAPRPAPRRQATPAPAAPVARTSIIASADISGVTSGSTLTRGSLAEAFLARAKSQKGLGRSPGTFSQLNVATIQRHFDADGQFLLTEDMPQQEVLSILASASREDRLQGGSLVAAGGWCAPSETMYGIPADETLAGIIDLPTVGVARGGINYTPGPDFADIYTSAGFFQTEAEAIAGTTKTCIEVDCPDFTEVRLDAVGMCVKAPLLTRAAYPETIARWISGTEVALQHKIAARLITAMRNSLGTLYTPTLTGTPITWGLLTALELVIEGQRQAYRLAEGESLEVVAPRWGRIAIRHDVANRMGIGKDDVTNADIAAYFATIGANVQWVLGYQELANPTGALAFPATMEVMVYTAGTFVKGMADVVTLDTIYDTADLQTNVFTAAFAEDGVLLAKMKHGGRKLQVPVRITGELGAAQLDDSWGTAQVENAGAAAV